MKFSSRGEPHGYQLGCLALYLVRLGFTDAFDGNKGLLRSVGYSLYRVVTRFTKLLNVSCTDAKALEREKVRTEESEKMTLLL